MMLSRLRIVTLPDFNFRRELAVVVCEPTVSSHSFDAALEPHSEYNGCKQFTMSSACQIADLRRLSSGGVDHKNLVLNNYQRIKLMSLNDVAAQTRHTNEAIGHYHLWKGYYSPTFNSTGAN